MDLQERLQALLSRKFLLSLIAVILVIFAVPVDGAAKLDFLKWIVGFFLGANVLQKGALEVLKK